ncbi:hypothetical protein PHYSODRAFT_342342 [Phytophthora sojae]|uniref:Uncharacterized protein n=1 Tax=Phytophthora sojae (strain P6497) TaxID=1094619 RepID=G5AG20_PHYSP|nr:hypothetical protein PHYSODRAFT_342342 [Phytophthora sojae]EGZ05532.1 hypothetical protein PHYSODRAFT_342342 [Phytophthora sojae]|eukprot:XP_009539063.1 hypothetical protein PHYSODRAFT_342342 [Phytophthora sojae]
MENALYYGHLNVAYWLHAHFPGAIPEYVKAAGPSVLLGRLCCWVVWAAGPCVLLTPGHLLLGYVRCWDVCWVASVRSRGVWLKWSRVWTTREVERQAFGPGGSGPNPDMGINVLRVHLDEAQEWRKGGIGCRVDDFAFIVALAKLVKENGKYSSVFFSASTPTAWTSVLYAGEAGSSLNPEAVNHSNHTIDSALDARLRARFGCDCSTSSCCCSLVELLRQLFENTAHVLRGLGRCFVFLYCRWIECSSEGDRPCQQLGGLYVEDTKGFMNATGVRAIQAMAFHLGEVKDQGRHQHFEHLTIQVPRHCRETSDRSEEEILQLLHARSDDSVQGGKKNALLTRDIFQPPRSTTQFGLMRLTTLACMAPPLLKECELGHQGPNWLDMAVESCIPSSPSSSWSSDADSAVRTKDGEMAKGTKDNSPPPLPKAPKPATTKGTAEDRGTNEEWEEEEKEKEDEEGGRPIRSLRLAATHSSRCRQQQQHAELQSQPRTTPPQQ